jgi:hypothetical protein
MIGSSNDICRELYEAREQLAKVGRPETLPNGRIKTWDKYLQDVGLAYRSDLMPNGSRLTCDIPLSKRYQIATQTHEEAHHATQAVKPSSIPLQPLNGMRGLFYAF